MKVAQVFAFLMVGITMLTIGQAKDSDKVNDAFEITTGNKKVAIKAKTETELRKGELDFELETKSEFFRGKMEFESETDDGSVEKSIKNEIRLVIREIIEFIPSSPDAGFGGETPESTYPSGGNWVWNDIAHTVEGSVHTFTASTTDNVFAVIAKYSESETGELSSDLIKMDFQITDFPFSKPGETKLAFKCQTRSKNKVKTKDSGDEIGTDVDGSVVQGKLQWVSFAEADGANVKIITSIGDEEEDGEGKGPNMFFTVDTLADFSTVLWDPTLTVGRGPGANEISPVMIAGAVMGGLTLIALVTYFVRKARMEKTNQISDEKAAVIAANP